MEASTWLTYAAAWLVTTALVLLSTLHHRRKINLPPGPRPWPIIGNFNLIGSLPHLSMDELSKKYGPIIMIWFGSVPVLVGSSAEMAKLFLKTYDAAFAGRPKLASGKYTTYNYTDITWADYGPYLRQARKWCITELFSPKKLQSYEYIRIQELSSLLKRIFELNQKPMLLKDHLSTLGLNMISRIVLGKRYVVEGESSIISPEEFRKMLDELIFLNRVLNLGDWIPCLRPLDVQGYVKRMKVLSKKFDLFLEHVVDEHTARMLSEKENWVPKDMMDVLLQLADDPNLEVKLGRTGVKAISQDLIVGGTDNSATVIERAMSELLRNPQIMLKAMQELDCVIGKEKWVAERDIENLPYIRAIAKETMRLHPVEPLLSSRMSTEDVQIKGYDVPKGSLVLVNTFTAQRDPMIYDKPEEFSPDRFIGKGIEVKGQNFELLPFGSGRRMCLGYNLGLKIVESSLANILHGFTWELPSRMKPEDLKIEEIFGLTTPKKISLVACAKPRLPPHLYHMLESI